MGVEGIHDRATYDTYAKTNGDIFKPWMSEFAVLARAYTNDMARFQVLHRLPMEHDADSAMGCVDRMPVLACRGKGILNWLLSDEYLGTSGNLHTRHASAFHGQLYVLVGDKDLALADAA